MDRRGRRRASPECLPCGRVGRSGRCARRERRNFALWERSGAICSTRRKNRAGDGADLRVSRGSAPPRFGPRMAHRGYFRSPSNLPEIRRSSLPRRGTRLSWRPTFSIRTDRATAVRRTRPTPGATSGSVIVLSSGGTAVRLYRVWCLTARASQQMISTVITKAFQPLLLAGTFDQCRLMSAFKSIDSPEANIGT